jgi:cell division protein ZapA
MAEVTLAIGGRSYTIACRDGGEDHLRALAARVDAKVEEARSAVGTANEVRQLLFAALLLADDISDAVSNAAPVPADASDTVDALASLAARMESLADTLETGTPNA